MDQLSIACVQSDIVWEEKSVNLNHLSTLIAQINENIDLILLPEMFSTGFSMKPKPLAEQMNGLTVDWMKTMARNKKCCVAGSLIVEENGTYFNRFIFAQSDGRIQFYNKRHLFGYGGEDAHYKAGEAQTIVHINGWRIIPRICYDLRFPVWNRSKGDADLMIFIANWPDTRIAHWEALLRSRAIENQIYVLGVNRVGRDGNDLNYVGHSAAYSYSGTELWQLDNKEQTQVFSIQKLEQETYRTAFPFLNDGDSFKIEY